MFGFKSSASSSSTPVLPAPVSARVNDSPRSSTSTQAAALDNYFGTQTPSAPEPRARDNTPTAAIPPLPLDLEAGDMAPPPYASAFDLPAYGSPDCEPDTLAKHLFKWGFLLPLFWLFGSFILLNTLIEPSEWKDTKSALERATIMRSLRIAERKWARRCLFAWVILCLVLVTVVFGVLAAVRWS